MPESGLADSLLQPVEHSYTVESLNRMARGCGLEILSPCIDEHSVAAGNFEWTLAFDAPALQHAYEALDDVARWQVTNLLMFERSPTLWFYLQRTDSSVPRAAEPTINGRFLDAVFVPAESPRQTYVRGTTGRYELANRTMPFPAREPDAAVKALVRAADGRRTMRDVFTQFDPVRHLRRASPHAATRPPLCRLAESRDLGREVRALIVRLARENPRWGYQRIVDELKSLGVVASATTVRKVLREAHVGLTGNRRGPSWREFLRSQASSVIAVDFFIVETFWLQRLYVLFFIEVGCRRVHLAGCTAQPHDEWVTQQARQVAWTLVEPSEPIRFLVRDHDRKFTGSFDAVFEAENVRIVRTPIQVPEANGIAERFVRTARSECLDWLEIVNGSHLERALTLVALKDTYDPTNVFCFNHNIPPSIRS